MLQGGDDVKRTMAFFAALLLSLALAGCGGGINDTPGYEVPDVYVAAGTAPSAFGAHT